ncbi:MAG: prepilin-type N-terminal cleavage/methylation domain-containing protein [Brachymonas sp.]|nr:prepilin-type N-terminal cleavage/methylation domain-containing protein [Brachymonas sp.]
MLRSDHSPSRGFTLIEVLIALMVMSLMAVLTWQGVDGMARATQQHRERGDEIAAAQTAPGAMAYRFGSLDRQQPNAACRARRQLRRSNDSASD